MQTTRWSVWGAALAVGATTFAAPAWAPVSSPPSGAPFGVAAFDGARGRLVIFGGDAYAASNETWEADGAGLRRRAPAPPALTPRCCGGIAYDKGRDRVVLFGGRQGGGLVNQTWEYDGIVWSPRAAAPLGLTPRSDVAMAYDDSRSLVVLHGGSPQTNDTWFYDATGWRPGPPPATGMLPRSGAAMAFDGSRGRLVLVGGASSGTQFLSDTWELGPTGWSQGPSGPWPRGIVGLGIAYDEARGRIVVWGGVVMDIYQNTGLTNQTWELVGSTWRNGPVAPSDLTPEHGAFHLAYDTTRRRLVLLGSPESPVGSWQGEGSILWEYDGTGWLRSFDGPQMSRQWGHAMVWDSGRRLAVAVGLAVHDGYGRASTDTWEFDGITWKRGAEAPSDLRPRWHHALAYDTRRARIVMQGGFDGTFMNDTWELDDAGWHPGAPPPPAFTPRSDHAMAYDPVRARTVLFGGWQAGGGTMFVADTWEYDGQVWRLASATGPPAREDHAMVFDPAQGRIVLFGGTDGPTAMQETWTYDGAWRNAAQQAPGRFSFGLGADQDRRRLVMFGGNNGSSQVYLDDTWELTSLGWTPGAAPPAGFLPRELHAMAPFPSGGGVLLQGGNVSMGQVIGTTDAWLYSCATVSPPTLPSGALGATYSASLSGSGGTAPYAFTVENGSLPPGIALSASGIVSGVPLAEGCFEALVKASDASGCAGSKAYRLQVGSCCLTLPISLPEAIVGNAYDRRLGVDGGTPPYTFALIAGALPAGLSLTSDGVLAGTPVAEGTFRATLEVIGGSACQTTKSYDLVVRRLAASFRHHLVLGPAPLGAIFEGDAGPGADASAFTWDFGDGSTATTVDGITGHTYTASGRHTVSLTVRAGSAADTTVRKNAVLVTSSTAFDDIIVAPGPGLWQHSEFHHLKPDGTFYGNAFPDDSPHYGSNVAGGNITSTSASETITGVGPGPVYGPRVRAFLRDQTPIPKVNFFAYGTLKWGVNVASAELDGDSFDEILTGAGPGAVFGPHVRAFDFDGNLVEPIAKVSYFAYATLKYGVMVTGGSIDADAFDEMLTGPGPGAVFGATVRGFDYDGLSVRGIGRVNYWAYPTKYGVHVSAGDFDGDPFSEIGTGPGPGPANSGELRGWNYDGISVAALPGFDDVAYASAYGIEVDAAELTGDGNGDVQLGQGPDPASPARHRGFSYDGASLMPLGYSDFVPFASTPSSPFYRYGLKVASLSP